MLGIIYTIFNVFLWGLLIYGIIIMFEIEVSFIKKGIPIYDVPLEYIGSIVKPITIFIKPGAAYAFDSHTVSGGNQPTKCSTKY